MHYIAPNFSCIRLRRIYIFASDKSGLTATVKKFIMLILKLSFESRKKILCYIVNVHYVCQNCECGTKKLNSLPFGIPCGENKKII